MREYCEDCACEPAGVCRHCFEKLESENKRLREKELEIVNKYYLAMNTIEHLKVPAEIELNLRPQIREILTYRKNLMSYINNRDSRERKELENDQS